MKVYLDIDGVLLTKSKKIPPYAFELIDFVTSNCECYWLTTHCKHGENKTLQYLKEYYPKNIIEKLASVQKTNWSDLKTEAINIESTFFWLEDYPFESEKVILAKNQKLESLLKINLNEKKALLFALNQIKSKMIQ